MELNGLITPPNVIAVCLALIPFLAAAVALTTHGHEPEPAVILE